MGVAAQRKDDGRLSPSRPDLAELKARLAQIHPGYGFLSESPEFAQACADAQIDVRWAVDELRNSDAEVRRLLGELGEDV